jgi:hypothetical protein
MDSQFSSRLDDDETSLNVDFDGGQSAATHASTENAENVNLKNEVTKTSVIRCLVITTLLTTAAIVANVALIMALNEEEVEFKREYTRLSNRVIDSFFEGFTEKISAADSWVSQMSFDASLGSNLSIPEFEIQSNGIRRLSSSTTVTFSPLIRGESERTEWEAYALDAFDASSRSSFVTDYSPHGGKYDSENDPLVSYRDTGDRGVEEGIYRVEEGAMVSDTGSALYAPIWQVGS